MIPSAAPAESFLEALLRVTGISATPSQQKGSEEENFTGNLMLVDLTENSRRSITSGGGYRSPVIEPGAGNIVAIKAGSVILMPVAGGQEQAVRTGPGITKLIGFDGSDPDKLLVLFDAEGNDGAVGFLSFKNGKVTPLPCDRKSKEQREVLNHLKGWERVYGEVKLYPQERTKNVMGRTKVWTEVFLQRGEEFPLNISNCDGKNCGQPSLSQDKNLVVYVVQNR